MPQGISFHLAAYLYLISVFFTISVMKKKKIKNQTVEIEVPEIKNPKKRLILVIALLVVGIGLTVYGIIDYFRKEAGLQRIETTEGLAYASEYMFLYELGERATSEYRDVARLYTSSLKRGHAIFTMEENDTKNVLYLNSHLNEEVEVEPELYNALSLIKKHENRAIYLAPVYEEYGSIFGAVDDSETIGFDPYKSQQQHDYLASITAYSNDPAHIDVELKGNNKVILHVSDEYLKFAADNGITRFVDFYWYGNAFIVDLISQSMKEAGFNKGVLTSNDGFTSCMGTGNYLTVIYDRENNVVRDIANLNTKGPCNIVSLRNYNLSGQVGDYYYEYKDGSFVTAHIDPQDGLYKDAITNLVTYSYEDCAAEVLLKTVPVYVNNHFDEAGLSGLMHVYTKDRVIYYNDPAAVFTSLFDREGVTYRLHH